MNLSLSGARKSKLAKEKTAKQAEAVDKMPKMDLKKK